MVICGEPEYFDEHRDVLLNPRLIIEVLSASTEAFDRGTKFIRYQRYNPSLTDYVLISQDCPQIEHFHLEPDGSWRYQGHHGLAAIVELESIRCRLPAGDVYRRLKFDGKGDD